MAVVRALMLSLATLLLLFTGTARAALIDQQRTLFLQAEKALSRDDMPRFFRLREQLRGYPLYPYLEYQALLKRIDTAGAAEITNFLSRYDDTPLAARLRSRWLDGLAKKKRWLSYLEFYRADVSISRRCHQLTALIETGRAAEALAQVEEVWLHGRSRPTACDPVFAAWTKAGHRTREKNWQRIALAMEAGQWKLANYLGRDFSKTDRAWLDRWIDLYRNPAKPIDLDRFDQAHPYREAMLAHAIRRWSGRDANAALRQWAALNRHLRFSPDQVKRTERYVLQRLVRNDHRHVVDFIDRVDVGDDLRAHESRIRNALFREDWMRVARWIRALPSEERANERWRYWLARAEQGLGNHDQARSMFEDAAAERSYYGFLAADRIDVDYHLEHAQTTTCPAHWEQIKDSEAIARARELYKLERWIDARREWRDATRHMTTGQLKAAATLAKQEGWHDRAIFTLAKTGFWDDLELRFPLQHAELVAQNARTHDIDKAWVFAIMRQESAFMRHARSHAGAMGLMQLMPATARNVARTMLRRTPPRRSELMKPDTNIALGSAYLRQMKDKLGDSTVLATAAYNAGPHRVSRWLPRETLPADIWIELVPFRETRGYLQRVLSYIVIYEKRMGRTPTRLSEHLHPVPPAISQMPAIRAANQGKA